MKVETKYNIKDTIFFMKNHQPFRMEITEINVRQDLDHTFITYQNYDLKNRVYEKDCSNTMEGLKEIEINKIRGFESPT
jgi:hypothetical protein